jgi:alkylation response protein AidB-like acyl-CoA dehydrogenase
MIGFLPTDDQKLMVDSVGQFARTIRPRIRECERLRAVPEDLRKKAHELGLGLVALPEAIGGAGLGLTTAVLLEEEVAWGDPAAAFGFGGPGAFGLAVAELASAEQAKALLAPYAADDGWKRFGAVAWGEKKAVADREGLATTATKQGNEWVLRGEKSYVAGFDRADAFVVFAQVSEREGWDGLGAFVVKKDAAGLSTTARHTTLGLDVASFGGLVLDGVKVADADRLTGGADFDAAVLRFFAKHALLVAARSVGLSRAAFEATREYCETRKAFGKPIGHFQAVAFTLADRAMDVDAARAMVHRAAWTWDALAQGNETVDEKQALLRTAHAVSYAHEAAMRCGDDAVQLHGGSGFMRDYPVEKFMRDAKQLGLCGLTSEHADQLAAAIEIGAPLRLGAILPTAETQPTFV